MPLRDRYADYRVFWRQFRDNFHSTGAVLPSGRTLARSLCRFVPGSMAPRKILEIGPGTGAVTARLVQSLGAHDQLDLVELNEHFVARLEQRFAREPHFQRVADRARVLHQGVEQLSPDEPYDLIISGLPLNNFSVATVEHLLQVMLRLLRPDGTLSFFEYIAIRAARGLIGRREQRLRVQGISRALRSVLEPYEFRRDWVWSNVPPAWVHHLRVPASGNGA